VRAGPWWSSGCAFDHWDEPVVEYRVWPIAASPRRPLRFCSSKDLRHEAHVAEHREPAAVGDRDARRLLPAMLQREEAEVRDTRDVAAGCADAEDAAHR
jgi:hypothetical protein